eukprot:1890105-Pleurochrysis_carterae.AAC.1
MSFPAVFAVGETEHLRIARSVGHAAAGRASPLRVCRERHGPHAGPRRVIRRRRARLPEAPPERAWLGRPEASRAVCAKSRDARAALVKFARCRKRLSPRIDDGARMLGTVAASVAATVAASIAVARKITAATLAAAAHVALALALAASAFLRLLRGGAVRHAVRPARGRLRRRRLAGRQVERSRRLELLEEAGTVSAEPAAKVGLAQSVAHLHEAVALEHLHLRRLDALAH